MKPERDVIYTAIPVKSSERYVVVEVLWGFALFGMLLPLFGKVPNRTLLVSVAVLLLISVAVDFIIGARGIYPAGPIVKLQQDYCRRIGTVTRTKRGMDSDVRGIMLSWRDLLCSAARRTMDEKI